MLYMDYIYPHYNFPNKYNYYPHFTGMVNKSPSSQNRWQSWAFNFGRMNSKAHHRGVQNRLIHQILNIRTKGHSQRLNKIYIYIREKVFCIVDSVKIVFKSTIWNISFMIFDKSFNLSLSDHLEYGKSSINKATM